MTYTCKFAAGQKILVKPTGCRTFYPGVIEAVSFLHDGRVSYNGCFTNRHGCRDIFNELESSDRIQPRPDSPAAG